MAGEKVDISSAWSAIIYQKPVAPISTSQADVFQDLSLSQSDGPWRNYRRPGDDKVEAGNDRMSTRPCNAQVTASENAKLYRIVHKTILTYCGHDGKVTGQTLSRVYSLYRRWKEDLPQGLRDVEGDREALPHIMFLQ